MKLIIVITALLFTFSAQALERHITDKVVTFYDAQGNERSLLYGVRRDYSLYDLAVVAAVRDDAVRGGWREVYAEDMTDGSGRILVDPWQMEQLLHRFIERANRRLNVLFGVGDEDVSVVPSAEATAIAFVNQHLGFDGSRFVYQ